MTDTERKALALVNEALGLNSALFIRAQSGIHEALCRAIEQHEAFRQEVSDAVVDYCGYVPPDSPSHPITRFIIAKPDPLVEALAEATGQGENYIDERDAIALRAAIEKRGGKIVWGEK